MDWISFRKRFDVSSEENKVMQPTEYSCGSKSQIRVPVLGNRLFVLGYLSISMGILVKALPHLRCVAAFTNILIEIIFRYAQK